MNSGFWIERTLSVAHLTPRGHCRSMAELQLKQSYRVSVHDMTLIHQLDSNMRDSLFLVCRQLRAIMEPYAHTYVYHLH